MQPVAPYFHAGDWSLVSVTVQQGRLKAYYNLGFIFLALAIGCISHDYIVLTKVIAEIWEHEDIKKKLK